MVVDEKSALHPPESKNLLTDLITRSLQGYTGSGDILVNGKMNTIAYEPVAAGGKNFLTSLILLQSSVWVCKLTVSKLIHSMILSYRCRNSRRGCV